MNGFLNFDAKKYRKSNMAAPMKVRKWHNNERKSGEFASPSMGYVGGYYLYKHIEK